MATLSVGHATTDLSSGAVSALLVFLRPELGLSFTEVAAVILASTLASSVVQPVFGLLSDRRGAIWLLPGGVAVSGVGIALAAVAPSYLLVLLCVLASGVGIAAYHPEASKFASFVSGDRRASGMSLFSIGGNIGFALGPLLTSSLVLWLGLEGGLLLAVPAVVMAASFLWLSRYLLEFEPARRGGLQLTAGEDRRGALSLLLTIIALRSVGHMGLFTFVPLWEVEQGSDEGAGSRVLTLFLVGGAIGTLVGGPIADRIGRRVVVSGSLALSIPLIGVYVLVGGGGGVVALTCAGAMLVSSFAVTIVMSQDYLPTRVGLASGLAIGFAIGLGGVAAIILGSVADAIDLRIAMLATMSGPVLGALLTFVLPSSRRPMEQRVLEAPA